MTDRRTAPKRRENASSTRRRLTGMIAGLDLVALLLVALTSGYSGTGDPLVLVGIGDTYGLLAAGFLYVTLLITPLALAFPKLPAKETWFLARRGLGISSLVFALPHALVSFFGPLGGLAGIPFLDPYTGWALVLGLIALTILAALGASASDAAVRKLGHPRWKLLHRTVYAAGVLTLVHLLLVGTHYGDPRSPWMFWSLTAVGFLVFLQAMRLDQWRARMFPKDRRYGPVTLFAVFLLTWAWFWTTSPPTILEGTGGVRWVTNHHGMMLPAPPPPEKTP